MNKIRYVFRITHIDNIPYINEVGFVLQDSVYASPNYKSIGDSEVIEKRATMIKGMIWCSIFHSILVHVL